MQELLTCALSITGRQSLTDAYGEKLVKEAIHRGLLAVAVESGTGVDILRITERGKRVQQGLPGEAERQLTFELDLFTLIKSYLQREALGELDHFTTTRQGKVIITVKG